MNPIERKTAEVLLGRGSKYRLPLNILSRLGFTHVKLTALKLGTELEIARILPTDYVGKTQADEIAYFVKHLDTYVRIVAIATLNSRLKIAFLTKIRMWQLRQLPTLHLYEIWLASQKYSGISDFTSIIKLAIETRRTRPNLSQK